MVVDGTRVQVFAGLDRTASAPPHSNSSPSPQCQLKQHDPASERLLFQGYRGWALLLAPFLPLSASLQLIHQ